MGGRSIGYNRWKWKDDGKVGRALGVSLIANVSDRVATDEFGWGIMLHVNNSYSIGLTDHDGDIGILVGGDLSKLWLKVSEKRKKGLKGE